MGMHAWSGYIDLRDGRVVYDNRNRGKVYDRRRHCA